MSKRKNNKKRKRYGTKKTRIKQEVEIKKYKNRTQYINLNNNSNNLKICKAIYLFRTSSQVIIIFKSPKIQCNQRQEPKMILRIL